ncbi:MAG: DEAD/DEAH box helicase [Lentisphaerota bacterium]
MLKTLKNKLLGLFIKKPKTTVKHPIHKDKTHTHTASKPKPKLPHPSSNPKSLPILKLAPELEGSVRFSDFKLDERILVGLQSAKFEYCTPVQKETIPHLLVGKDVSVKAQTGTGKTAVFLISIFEYLLNTPLKFKTPGFCRVLIIAPTRELAMQIFNDAQKLGKYCNFNNQVVYGGMDYKKQLANLNKHIDILIGTPGRLLDYAGKKALNLSKTEIFVIDEADRMLDMGFIPDVTKIERSMPPATRRHTMLFSATLTNDVRYLIQKWQKDPVTIELEPETSVPAPIEQLFYSVVGDRKTSFLLWLLEKYQMEKTLIFVNTKDQTFRLKKSLEKYHYASETLSSDIVQQKRIKTLDDFKSGKLPIIIATDVASRGIHVDDVSHVINYDIPERSEDYIHRIGRTGRAGKKGVSISFVCEYGSYSIPEIEKVLGYEIKSVQPEANMYK